MTRRSLSQMLFHMVRHSLDNIYCITRQLHLTWKRVKLGPVSERRLRENSEYVNPEMRETLGFPFQKGRFVKPEKAG